MQAAVLTEMAAPAYVAPIGSDIVETGATVDPEPTSGTGMTNATGNKLAPAFTWLFAIASILVGLGLAFATRGASSKVTGGLYFGALAVGGFLSVFLTRAKTGGAILSFLVGAAGASAAYYFVIAKMFSAVAEAAPVTSAADAHAAAAFQTAGSAIGGFIAVVVFLVTFIASLTGILAGSAARGKTGMSAVSAVGKSLAA